MSKTSSRIRLAAAASVVALALAACHTGRPHPSPPPPTQLNVPYGFSGSGLDGGGFVNAVAFDPAVPGVVLAGGDVSGILRSTDYGKTWTSADRGLRTLPQMKVASLLFSPSGQAYAAVGDEGAGGGLLVSTDAGLSWSLRSQVPQFSGGNNNGLPLPVPHPRSTGTLLALDAQSSTLYAATFHDGLMRSTDDGRTWTTLGLAGSYLRGLAMDPDKPDTLYVAAFDQGVFMTADARGSGPLQQLAGSPSTPEELAVVGGTLYAAAGRAGLFSFSGGTWRAIGPSGAQWEALTAYAACGQTVIYAGASGAGAQVLVRSADGGNSWTGLAGGPNVHTQVGGPGGPVWWLAARPGFMLGGSFYTASQIAVEPQASGSSCQRSRVLVAGRSGVWGSTDAGANWYPMVRGMGVTIVHDTKLSPLSPSYVVAAAADWTLLGSNDGGASFTVAASGAGTGYCLAVDNGANPPAFFAGTGYPDRRGGGEVFQSLNPTAGDWTSAGLRADGKVLALAVQRVDGQPVALAAVEGSGLWRRSGSQPWQQVNTDISASPHASGGVSISWPSGAYAYLYDRQSGLWRSADSGQTWTKIWSQTSTPSFTGWVAADPSVAGTVYVSIGDRGLFRLESAETGSVDSGQIHPIQTGDFQHPGPVAVDAQGAVWGAELASGGSPDLRVSADGGATWHSVADDAYRSAAVFPLAITPGPGGLVYISLDGDGLLIGRLKV